MSDFVCITQDPFTNPIKGDDEPEMVHSGTVDYVPRWKTSSKNPAKLHFFAVREGFSTEDDFNYVLNTFTAAAEEWNKINFGVTIQRTTERRTANFLLTFQAKQDFYIKWPHLASAFIGPHKIRPVVVYGLALSSKAERDNLSIALLHEIGHILGLRHEIEIKPDAGKPPNGTALQILAPNPKSVMNGEKRNMIQQSDIDCIREFYGKTEGWVLPGSTVKIKSFELTPLPVKKP
ncbi:hypothetical protein DE146DRAFT_764389 [Phaeosphaeria sp. MPI-PUGE-AT-0046c]|nr:hypothetical protein DE146DRAFT_764389 [Phaeosphaeria sp. MPI-PUGE-AT-0046c]